MGYGAGREEATVDEARARAEGDRESRLRYQAEAAESGHGRVYPVSGESDAAEVEALEGDVFVCEGCGAFCFGVVPGPLCSWCATLRKFES